MKNARIILELPCGCRSALYDGDLVSIPFGKLPTAVAGVIAARENAGCNCKAVDSLSSQNA